MVPAKTPHPFDIVGNTIEPSPAPNSGLPEFGTLTRPKSDKIRLRLGEGTKGDTGAFGQTRTNPRPEGNDRRLRSIVSVLLFTMDGATETCRAASAGGPPRCRRPSRARACKSRVHSYANYQTYCHVKAITITTTAVNRPSCAQTLAAKLGTFVLSLWIVMVDDLPFGRHL